MTSENETIAKQQRIESFKKMLLYARDQHRDFLRLMSERIDAFVADKDTSESHVQWLCLDTLLYLARMSERSEEIMNGAMVVLAMYTRLDADDCALFFDLNPELSVLCLRHAELYSPIEPTTDG